ncbi:hypothetical protein BDQ12DRAFT_610810 [Crucibulum laeve]|uniref:Secreted protein n=1 Tax=Crucibulum laeve TaxID=68775 RepID=A0A5C3LS47_9AGAR|nr:hypothetical protein BDQ12DRAFT_610810 [Crucibulum laeve]
MVAKILGNWSTSSTLVALVYGLLSLLLCSCLHPVASAPIGCSYSCPTTDLEGRVLVHSPHAIPFISNYSIFECMYVLPLNIL